MPDRGKDANSSIRIERTGIYNETNRNTYGCHSSAVAYPLVVLGITAAIATILGAIDTNSTDWNRTLKNVSLMSSSGVLMVMITEEGFFRGWLWASLKRAGQSDKAILLWTTLAFTVWHIFAVTLDTGFDLPAREIPIYLINGPIFGLIWGIVLGLAFLALIWRQYAT